MKRAELELCFLDCTATSAMKSKQTSTRSQHLINHLFLGCLHQSKEDYGKEKYFREYLYDISR